MAAIKLSLRYSLFLLLIFFASEAYSQFKSPLQKKVSLKTEKLSMAETLMELSSEAHFTFSYDAAIFSDEKDISIQVENKSLKTILEEILPSNIDYRISGSHLILLKKADTNTSNNNKQEYSISGKVHQALNASPLKGIVVYEVNSLVSAVTDDNGAFSLIVPAEFEQLALSFSQRAVMDTVIIIQRKDQYLDVTLQSFNDASLAKSIKDLPLGSSQPVESLGVVQQLVSVQSLLRTENSDLVLHKKGQVSILPKWGSNLKMSGLVENDFSVNILIGYAHGVNAFEVGGLLNVISEDVEGVQAGGIGNLVGRNTRGFQLGGIFNHNRGTFTGMQAAGITNLVIDSLTGVQFAGINNVLKGEMKGMQIAGIKNLTTRNVRGIQFAGLANVTSQDVQSIQISGLLNKGRNVEGVQLSGLINVAKQKIKGVQVAGLVNVAEDVDAVQFGGIGNISRGVVSGIQIGGVFNYAKITESGQLGLFNYADSASGTPVGLISFVKNGYRSFKISSNEIFPANLTLKTGVKRFHNILSFSYGSWQNKKLWGFGYGFGAIYQISKKSDLNIQYEAQWVNEREKFQKDLSLLNRVSLILGYNSRKGIDFTIGPVVNVWLTEWRSAQTGEYLSTLAPYTLATETLGSTRLQLWVGGEVGIQLFRK